MFFTESSAYGFLSPQKLFFICFLMPLFWGIFQILKIWNLKSCKLMTIQTEASVLHLAYVFKSDVFSKLWLTCQSLIFEIHSIVDSCRHQHWFCGNYFFFLRSSASLNPDTLQAGSNSRMGSNSSTTCSKTIWK